MSKAAVAPLNMQQPSSSIPGSSIQYTDGVCVLPKTCKGAKLSKSATAGALRVHLQNDPDDQYYTMDLEPGVPQGAIFDAVIDAGTTVTLDNVTLFPTE